MAGKKIKFEEEAISEILVADTDPESGAESSDVGLEQQQASAEVESQASISGGLPTWGPPQGRIKNIQPFVSPAKSEKK